jgi:hypothetical protein
MPLPSLLVIFGMSYVSRLANTEAHQTAKQATGECISIFKVSAFLLQCIQHEYTDADE